MCNRERKGRKEKKKKGAEMLLMGSQGLHPFKF